MTSGGHSKTEGWNLQLQGKVRGLELDLAEAERHLGILSAPDARLGEAMRARARIFLKKMAAKRERAAAQAKEIDAFLEQEGSGLSSPEERSDDTYHPPAVASGEHGGKT